MILIPGKFSGRGTPRNAASPQHGFYPNYEELFGGQPRTAELFDSLSKVSRSTALRFVTSIFARFRSDSAAELDIRGFLSDSDFELYGRWAQGRSNCRLFHQRQLYFLLHAISVACKQDIPDEDVHASAIHFGRAALVANSLLDIGIESPPEDMNSSAGEDWIMMISQFVHQPGVEVAAEIARASQFWRHISESAEMEKACRRRRITRGFGDYFQDQFQIPFQSFFNYVCSLFATYLNQEDGLKPQLLDPMQQFAEQGDPQVASSVLRILSQSLDDLASSLLCRPVQSWTRDPTLLRAKPIIELEAGKFACPDSHLLLNYLSDGVYWRLHDSFPLELRPRFRDVFGDVFESYVDDLLSKLNNTAAGKLARTYFSRPRFRGTNDEIADGIMFWHKALVLIEAKGVMLTSRSKFSGSVSEFRKGLEDALARWDSADRPNVRLAQAVRRLAESLPAMQEDAHEVLSRARQSRKGVAQLAYSIKRILDGESATIDLAFAKDTPIVPLMIVYDGCVESLFVRKFLQSRLDHFLKRLEVSSDERVAPLVVMSVRELEQIEHVTEAACIEEVIVGYTNDQNSLVGPFSNYLYNNFPHRKQAGKAASLERMERAFDSAIKELSPGDSLGSP